MTMTLSMPRAASAALFLEVLGALTVLYFMSRQAKELLEAPHVTNVTLQPVEAQPAPKLPEPPKPKPVPVHKASPPEPLVQPVKQEAPQEAENKALPAQNDPPPKMVQQAAAVPTPPVNAEVLVSFQSRVRAAVQDAVVYPMAARASHYSGRTRVGFSYLDGRVSDVKVLVSSGSTLLDQAAILAVKVANYPHADKEYSGRLLSFQLWVRFMLGDDQE